MKNSLHTYAEVLFHLVSVLEPRVKPLHGWFNHIVGTLDKWSQSEGNQGVKRMKDILGRSFEIICSEKPSEPLAFVKQDGIIPRLGKPLVERSRQIVIDAHYLSAILSLVRVTDLYLGRPTDSVVNSQLEIINNTKMPPTAARVISDFTKFVDLWLSAPHRSGTVLKRRFRIGEDSSMTNKLSIAMWSEKAGPNGPLTMNSHRDLLTLADTDTSVQLPDKSYVSLLEAVGFLSEEIYNNSRPGEGWAPNWFFPIDPNDYLDMLESAPSPTEGGVAQEALSSDIPHSGCPGKIGFKPEKAGKVRLIAMPDYYTQMVLQPVHRKLAEVLQTFEADCTFDQKSAIPKIRAWHEAGKTVCSFDQSSCTDLFPIDCQLIPIQEAFGKSFSKALKTVMVDRYWEVKLPSGRTKRVRWSVGQPLGEYASWPLMAVAHHLLVQYCAWRASGRPKAITPFNDYVICGDDVVIASKSVSDSYKRVVSLLGMRINMAKSHVSGGSTGVPPVSEFAKIYVWRGQPLNPVRPNLLRRAVEDWKYLITLVQDLRLGVWKVRKGLVSRLINKLHPNKTKVLTYLLSVPTEFGGFGFRSDLTLKGVITDEFDAKHIHPWILYLATRIRAKMLLESRQLEIDLTQLQEVGPNVMRVHPARQYVDEKLGYFTQLARYYQKQEVPTAKEIAISLLEDGVTPFDRYLSDEVKLSPTPAWSASDRDNDDKQKRITWDRVLSTTKATPSNLPGLLEATGRSLQEATYQCVVSTLWRNKT